MIDFQKFDFESVPVCRKGWGVAKLGNFSVIIFMVLLTSHLSEFSINSLLFHSSPEALCSFFKNVLSFLFRLVNFCSIFFS